MATTGQLESDTSPESLESETVTRLKGTDMTVDALLQTLAVKPTKDSQDKARREQQSEHREGDGEEPRAIPLRNAYGQIIGQTINITV
jgi:hypothetical protein